MTTTHAKYAELGYFEDQRPFYDDQIVSDWGCYLNPAWDRSRRYEVRRIARLTEGVRRVLDVGCGCGFHDPLLADCPGVERVVGVDYSSKSIEQANRHYPHPKVTRLVADVFGLQSVVTEYGPFDLVASFEVIEHVTDPQRFLNACAAATRENGYVAIIMPNRDRAANRIRLRRGRQRTMMSPLHFDEYTRDQLIGMGRGAGLVPQGHFGHSINVQWNRFVSITARTRLGLYLGAALPSLADFIGVVFQKSVVSARVAA